MVEAEKARFARALWASAEGRGAFDGFGRLGCRAGTQVDPGWMERAAAGSGPSNQPLQPTSGGRSFSERGCRGGAARG